MSFGFGSEKPEGWNDYPEYYREALSMFCTHPNDTEKRDWLAKKKEENEAWKICNGISPKKRKQRNPLKKREVLHAEAMEFRKIFLDWASGMPFEIEIRHGYNDVELDYFILRFGERRVDVETGDWLFSLTYWENEKTKAVKYENFDHREVGMKMPDAEWYQKAFQRITDFMLAKE